MKKVILVAHGNLAYEMKNSAEMIFGELPTVQTIAFLKEEGLDTIQEKILNEVQEETASYLIFTDLFCGTPYNASCAIAMKQPEKTIEVVSGLSLPLLLEVASLLSTKEIPEIVEYVISVATQTVQSFKQQAIQEEEDF